jgi:hypothetical protein
VPLVLTLPYAPWRERGGVVNGEFRWRLGVRPLDLANWIEFGPDADGPTGWIAEKAKVLDAHHDTAFAVLDGVEPEANEIAGALIDHLAIHAPGRSRTLDPNLHPLEAASRLVPEDLVLMVERAGRLVFGGGAVCFPNRWDLPSKLGRTMAEVHAPVSRLNDQLESGVDSFLDRLRPERSFWRLGWGIIDVPDGYTPPDGTGPTRPVDPQPTDLFVRVERETLRRFPHTNCVLFTIRTYVAPVVSVLTDGASSAALSAAISAMANDVRDYKDLVTLADPLAATLVARR